MGRRSLPGVRGRCGRSRGRPRDRGTIHCTAARAHPPARLSHGQGERRPADRARASVFRRRSAYPRIQRRRPAGAVDQGRRDPHRDRPAPHRPVDPAHRGRLAGDRRPARRRRVGADGEGGIQARAGGGNPGIGRPQLSPRDRAILRLHVVEGVSIEKIAASYGVHRVTVARWVWTAGETLLDGLRATVPGEVRDRPAEFDSMARMARSQLSIDLAALLAS